MLRKDHKGARVMHETPVCLFADQGQPVLRSHALHRWCQAFTVLGVFSVRCGPGLQLYLRLVLSTFGLEGPPGLQAIRTPVNPSHTRTTEGILGTAHALRCWRRHAFSERGCFGVRCRLSLQMSLVATAPTLSSEQGKSFGNCNCSPQQCLVRGGSEGVWGMQDTPVCPFARHFLFFRSEALCCWRRQVSSDLSCYCVRFRPAVLQMCAASTPATLTAKQGRSLGRNTWSLQQCLARPCRARDGSEGVRGMQDTPVCPFTSRFLAVAGVVRCLRNSAVTV